MWHSWFFNISFFTLIFAGLVCAHRNIKFHKKMGQSKRYLENAVKVIFSICALTLLSILTYLLFCEQAALKQDLSIWSNYVVLFLLGLVLLNVLQSRKHKAKKNWAFIIVVIAIIFYGMATFINFFPIN